MIRNGLEFFRRLGDRHISLVSLHHKWSRTWRFSLSVYRYEEPYLLERFFVFDKTHRGKHYMWSLRLTKRWVLYYSGQPNQRIVV